MKQRLLTWEIEKNDNETLVVLNGIINEDFDTKRLVSGLKERNGHPLRLDLRKVKRINSMGIREWFNFLKELAWPENVILSECSLIFTEVLSQIEEMGHGCFIQSCYLSIWCDDCEEDFEFKIDLTKPLSEQPKEASCKECSRACIVETWSIEGIIKRQTG